MSYSGRTTLLITGASAQLLLGCTHIPALVVFNRAPGPAPAGPKVASLVANLKCELWSAATSDEVLPSYRDDLTLVTRNKPSAEPDRAFTMRNFFTEVEYVGLASYTLDVTEASSLNPIATWSQYYHPPTGVFPATGATLSVGGQLSETAHRFINFNSSVDFGRLVDSQPSAAMSDPAKKLQKNLAAPPTGACDRGAELGGNLGLKETLATGLIAAAMNDIAVFPSAEITPTAPFQVSGIAPGISIPATYPFGQISVQIDFTIIGNVNGGPNWILQYFRGAGGNPLGLVNLNRQVKDTVAITFVPVCMRAKYIAKLDDTTKTLKWPHQYIPKPIEGSPGWINFLPLCKDINRDQAVANAVAKAKENNNQLFLQQNLHP